MWWSKWNFWESELSITEDKFLKDDVLFEACVMKVMIIGEYASRLSKEFKENHHEIERQIIKAVRNYYAHDYRNLAPARVWGTITKDIPVFKQQLITILNEM